VCNNRIKYLEDRNKELAKIIHNSRLSTPSFTVRENQLDMPNFNIQELLLDSPNFEIVSVKALATPTMKITKEKIKISKPNLLIVEKAVNENGKILLPTPSKWRIEEILNSQEAQEEFNNNLEEMQEIYNNEIVPLQATLINYSN
jgi:CRISPR/Cas system-associated exonuclease Cas4 (RecB family)